MINPSIRYHLSERFRLRFEEVGFGVLNDAGETEQQQHASNEGVVDIQGSQDVIDGCRAVDGELVTDEIAQHAQKYDFLMAKIDDLLERLDLEA